MYKHSYTTIYLNYSADRLSSEMLDSETATPVNSLKLLCNSSFFFLGIWRKNYPRDRFSSLKKTNTFTSFAFIFLWLSCREWCAGCKSVQAAIHVNCQPLCKASEIFPRKITMRGIALVTRSLTKKTRGEKDVLRI